MKNRAIGVTWQGNFFLSLPSFSQWQSLPRGTGDAHPHGHPTPIQSFTLRYSGYIKNIKYHGSRTFLWPGVQLEQLTFLCLTNLPSNKPITPERSLWSLLNPGPWPGGFSGQSGQSQATNNFTRWCPNAVWPHVWVLCNSLAWTQPHCMYQLWATTKWSIAP